MNKKTALLFLCILFAGAVVARAQKWQPGNAAGITPTGNDYVKAHYCGGDSCQDAYFRQHISYPAAARESNVQGQVIVQFFIDKYGNISQAKVVRGIGSGCDEEALRRVSAMPVWEPAMFKKRPVPSVQTMQVNFRLG